MKIMKKSKYPKISFKMDIDSDIQNAIDFITGDMELIYKNMFLPEDLRFILNGKFNHKEIVKILKEYARVYYYLHEEEVGRKLRVTANHWKRFEKKYFSLVDKIFGNFPWPKWEYVGLITIFKIFPANENTKVFNFPYDGMIKIDVLRIVAHEMLHMIFFSYVKSRYNITKDTKLKGRAERYLWAVSEVFNSVIESWGPFAKIFGEDKHVVYPGLEKMYTKMRNQWNKKQDIEWLLDQWLKKV